MGIYNSKAIPVSATPRSIDPADYPSLKAWFQFMQSPIGNGTTLTDTAGNVTTLAGVQGTGDLDVTYGALTTSQATGDYANGTYSTSLNPGTNSMIIEVEATIQNTSDTGAFTIRNGNVFDANKGWAFGITISGAEVRALFYVRNAANGGAVSTTLGTAPDLAGAKHHICLVWDRTIPDPGSIDYYVDGVKQGTFVLSGTVGTSVDAVGSNVSIGFRDATKIVDGVFTNVRVWTPSSIPANIGTIVADMATNPNELPTGMLGV